MKAKDLRDLTAEELENRLEDTRRDLFNARFEAATGALENTSRIALLKRDIARILTAQREQRMTESR